MHIGLVLLVLIAELPLKDKEELTHLARDAVPIRANDNSKKERWGLK